MRIIYTDPPLLFFWALASLSYVKMLRGRDLRWTALLGVSLGFGLLAKYAMIYFLLGIVIVEAANDTVIGSRRQRWLTSTGVFEFERLGGLEVVNNSNLVGSPRRGLHCGKRASIGPKKRLAVRPIDALE